MLAGGELFPSIDILDLLMHRSPFLSAAWKLALAVQSGETKE